MPKREGAQGSVRFYSVFYLTALLLRQRQHTITLLEIQVAQKTHAQQNLIAIHTSRYVGLNILLNYPAEGKRSNKRLIGDTCAVCCLHEQCTRPRRLATLSGTASADAVSSAS